jgi:hypothetical protein
MIDTNSAYEYCSSVIDSCKTQEQLKDARNLVNNFLTINGETSMPQWMLLMNQLLNKEMLLNYASKDSE